MLNTRRANLLLAVSAHWCRAAAAGNAARLWHLALHCAYLIAGTPMPPLQENDCLLIKPDKRTLLESICARERCLMQVIGTVDGSGRVVLVDRDAAPGSPMPVDLDLEKVLGDMPNKTFRCACLLAPSY